MKIFLSKAAQKQVAKLDKPIQKRIVEYLEGIEKLDNPRSEGKALTGNLAGKWRYRVGDYRIICEIIDKELIISVIQVGHRKEVYDK